MTELAGWQNFYVIMGSSAGALIGLQFVVITLIANRVISPGQQQAGDAFATPAVVHFATVLVMAAILTAPWHGMNSPSACVGALGAAGVVYEIIVIRRMRRQTAYVPMLEDWMFHAVLPFAAYILMAVSALETRSHAYQAMFAVAAAVLLLLLVGIHNAWDAVTYHIFHGHQTRSDADADR
ncbi:MAG TPA: hypothetical protein VMU05_19920 [Dongiaceae bacterium]|nr:hypothetical protein [Dongiaceae bacterium]